MRSLLALAVVLAVLPRDGRGAEPPAAGRDVHAFDRILTVVQTGLVRAQKRTREKGLPEFSGVKLTLQTEFVPREGGGLGLSVLPFDVVVEKERVQRMVLKLKPPHPYADTEEGEDPLLSERLSDAITAALTGVDRAALRKPPLQLGELSARIYFVLQKQEGTDGKLELTPVFGAAGDLRKRPVHILEIAFGKREKKKDEGALPRD